MDTAASTGLAEATRRLAALREEREAERLRHEREADRLDGEIAAATDRRDLVLAGVPLASVELAESLIYVRGREHALAGEGPAVIRKAIDDLATGAERLRHGYLGTKRYDRWYGQAEGGSYGSSPRHGTKMLEIGLVPEYRARPRWPLDPPELSESLTPRPPTEAQLDAAIAYLHALFPRATP